MMGSIIHLITYNWHRCCRNVVQIKGKLKKTEADGFRIPTSDVESNGVNILNE